MFIKFEENDITLVDPIIKLLKIIDSYIKTNNIKNINTMRKKDFIIIFIIFFSICFTLFFTFLFQVIFRMYTLSCDLVCIYRPCILQVLQHVRLYSI